MQDSVAPPVSDCLLAFSARVTIVEAMQELERHLLALRAASAGTDATTIQPVADLHSLQEVDTSALTVLIALDRESRRAYAGPLLIRHAPGNLVSLARLSSLTSTLCWEGITPDADAVGSLS